MAGKRRRPGRARPSWWTCTALAVGAALLLTGGYLQFRTSGADEGRQQAAAGPSAVSSSRRTTSAVPAKPSSKQPTTSTTRKTTVPPESRSTAPARPGNPVKLSVPTLGVSARVLSITVRDGALIPPSNPRLVGWWSDGAQPGATNGSAVITGHTVHTGGGAFDKLDQLTAGDPVKVTTGRGTIDYRVTSVTIYRKKALATAATKVFSQSVPGRLVLITCDDWDGTAYLSNAVVIASPVD